jgi:hypothetical protein
MHPTLRQLAITPAGSAAAPHVVLRDGAFFSPSISPARESVSDRKEEPRKEGARNSIKER